MLWDLDFSRSLHTCSKLFWCHAASTVEIRSRGYGPVNLDHPGGPGQPYERSVRVCFSVPGIPVKSWDKSQILGQNFVTVKILNEGDALTPQSHAKTVANGICAVLYTHPNSVPKRDECAHTPSHTERLTPCVATGPRP